MREIYILRKMSSNIFSVKIIDIIYTESTNDEGENVMNDIFLVMSLMPQSLKQALDATPHVELTEEHVVILLYNALCGLKHIHKGNIIHRDIKPANLLIDSSCRVAFCDYGLARTLVSKSD